MKSKVNLLVIIILFIYPNILLGQIGTMIPEDRLPGLEDGVLPWQKAGYLSQLGEEKIIVNKVYDVTTDLDTIPGEGLNSKIQYIIDHKPVNDTIMFYFPPGEYVFGTTLEVTRDNVIFKGAGSENTTLRFVHVAYITVDGRKWRFYDFIKIEGQSNDPIRNVGIEDLKIVRDDYYNVAGSFNVPYEGMSIRYKYAQNCWVSGVEFTEAARNHIYITNSNNLEFRGCYFHHAFCYGGGGYGYGIQIGRYSNKCLVEDNVFGKLRHAIVLSDEAHHNVIGYNAANEQYADYPLPVGWFNWVTPDMCIHGHNDDFSGEGPYENLFEGNCCSFVRIDDAHGSNGPRNTIFRNKADEVGFEVCSGSNEQNIVNNYFKCGNTALCTVYGVPWKCNSNNNLKENNKCKKNILSGWETFWVEDEDPIYYNDYSYYYESKPNFIPESLWPFNPVNQINPAEERWNSSEMKTVPAGWDHYHHIYYPHGLQVIGHVALSGGSGNITDVSVTFDKQGSGEDFTIHPDDNGDFSTTLFSDQFGTYDVIYSLYGYATVTLENIEIDEGENVLYLPDVILEECGCIEGHITLSGGGDHSRSVTDVTIKADVYSTHPNQEGDYALLVPQGTYDVIASLPAYRLGIENGIVVEEGESVTVNFTLLYTGYILVGGPESAHFITIQEGINAAQDGETVLVDDGWWWGITWPDSPKDITVRSLHGPENCSIHAGVYFGNSEDSLSGTIEGFKIVGEPVIVESGSPVIRDNIIEDISSDPGIRIESGSPLIKNNIITGCDSFGIKIEPSSWPISPIIEGNHIKECNGGIYSLCSDVTIKNNIIEDNINNEHLPYSGESGYGGGGIHLKAYHNYCHAEIIGNIIRGNKAREGGAIYVVGFDEVIIDNNEITENTLISDSDGYCEGIYCVWGDIIMLRNNLIHNNIRSPNPDAGGHTIYCYDIDLEMYNNTVANNANQIAIYEGIFGYGNYEWILKNNIIANNQGGIYCDDVSPIITYCDFWNNGANYGGNASPGDHCISIDPLFTDPVNSDYSLQWNSENFSPCIDAGDPSTEWDTDGTPPDMGAIPAMPHDYFYDQYDDHVLDRVDWISFPVLNRITSGYTEALGLLQRQGLIDNDYHSYDDILDYVVHEGQNKIYFADGSWQNELGDFDSKQGYKIVLQEGYTSADIGISGMWEDESEPIQLYADKANWVGCYLEEPASLADAFESIWDEWISIKSEHWAISRLSWEEEQIRVTVNPGELYIITVANDCELVWNESSPPVDPYIKEMTDYFAYEEKLDYMPILVDTVYGDTTVAEIGVFCEDECIGASKVNDGYPVQILAYTPDGGGNGELEFMLYYGGSKGKAKSVTDYRVYDSKVSAYLEKPVYYDKDSYVKVRLNTSEYTEPNLEFGLFSNYPNPVHRGITNISFVPAKEATNTEIQIFNIKGQLVRELDCSNAACKNGVYTISWDCRNENGVRVGSGIYFYKLISGDKTAIKKMLVLD